MNASIFQHFLGTLWTDSGESVLRVSGPDTEVRVTAPPREEHAVTASSRILRVDCAQDGHVTVWLSHR